MNIFFLDTNPKYAAAFHCDKHVVKMVLETAQLLSTAHHVLDGEEVAFDDLYKPTHVNHPSSVWVRSNMKNYQWTYELFCHLCNEYTKRFGKKHKTESKLRLKLGNYPKNIDKSGWDSPLSPPPQCMPEEYLNQCTVTAYRDYYCGEKARFARWSCAVIPEWYHATRF